MATIYIDGRAFEVDPSKNLLQECLSLGLDVPYFCWHPALGSVGACRQCAVKQFRDENDERGRIVMSCMTPALEGTRISVTDKDATEFRAAIVEFLMSNHPHDCPVCDEGGECHLQDMTVMTGHNYRSYSFGKRTFENQKLGPFINHEMNRCITCYRCVRFYKDHAGGTDLDAFASKNHIYFGRHEDGTLENEFSGNLVEVCPTGVFTDKTLHKHYTRKWDLQTAPSVCAHCSLGCNTIAGERYGGLRRILNRYNREVNGYFLCDRGRFGYEFVNRPERPKQISNQGEKVAKATALGEIGKLLAPESRVIGIGSPRASLEANFALRTLVGAQNFYSGMADQEQGLVERMLEVLRSGKVRAPSIHDVETSDAVLILGEDVTQTAPLLALAVRQAVKVLPQKEAQKLRIADWDAAATREVVQQNKGPLYIASSAGTKLDEVATETFWGAPNDVARLGFAVARELNPAAPAVKGLKKQLRDLAKAIAKALKAAEHPLVVCGSGSGGRGVVDAAAQVALALSTDEAPANLCFTAAECNTFGLALLGAQPTSAALGKASKELAAIVILENDLHRRAGAEVVNRFLDDAKNVVVIDHTPHLTMEKASMVLPAGTFAEAEGTLVNNEVRAQRFFQVYVPEGDVQASWRWLQEIAEASGRSEAAALDSPDALLKAMGEAFPILRPLAEKLPGADFRVQGEKVPRQSPRYSGRTAMLANVSVHEPKPPQDPDSPLAFSMEGYPSQPPSSLITRFWAPAWNSVQALNKFQAEVGGPLTGGDPGQRLVEPGANTVWAFSDEIPDAFKHSKREFLIVGLPHIFGSEELSSLSPAVGERAPEPYIAVNPEDAQALAVQEGTSVEVEINGTTYRQPAHLMASLARGLVGVPVGIVMLGVEVPAWGSCRKV